MANMQLSVEIKQKYLWSEAGHANSKMFAGQATKKCVGVSNKYTVVHQVKLAMKLEMNCYVLLSTLYAIHHANESVLSAIFELKDK